MNNTLKIWNNTATVEPVLQVFGYDQLNRIAESHAYKQNGAVSSIAAWNAGAPAGNLYRTGYTYDANGNIKNLQRYHATAQIDNLTYNYLSNKNQLGYVTETIGASTVAYDIDNQGAGNYTYDNIGNLLSDASEQIQEIKWNVYGKVTEVIRTSGSARPNLKFSYDAAGRRITKAAIWSGSTTYTFYTLDAQGNTLATYSKTSINSDLVLEENLLYGSSRIGLHRRDKKLSFVAQTPTPVQVTRGQKRYELSNHLGNVHVVVSDRKKTECVSNVFSAYEPEIINMYDYYPFGMLMEERKGQKPECTTSSSATTKTPYNYTFTWLTHDFAGSNSNMTVSTTGTALSIEYNYRTLSGWYAYRNGQSLVKGVTYTLSYQLQGAAPTGYTTTVGKTVQVRLKWGTTVVASANMTLTASMQSGSFNYTADYTGDYTIELAYVDVLVSKAQFLADNVKITYNSQLTTVNCAGTGEKYLYGFNGQMKDDEVYGVEGTSYTAEYWQYDSRLGRRWNVDPYTGKYPHLSPYATYENNPICMIDVNGDSTRYYYQGELIFISHDGPGSLVTFIDNDENLEKAYYMALNHTLTGGSLDDPSLNNEIRKLGKTYDIGQFRSFFKRNNNDIITSGTYTGYINEHGTYLIERNGIIGISSVNIVGQPGDVDFNKDLDINTGMPAIYMLDYLAEMHTHPNSGNPKSLYEGNFEDAPSSVDYKNNSKPYYHVVTGVHTITFYGSSEYPIGSKKDGEIEVPKNNTFERSSNQLNIPTKFKDRFKE